MIYFISLQIGPGIVYLTFDSLVGKGAFLQALSPMEPLVQRLIQHIVIEWKVPMFIAKFFLLSEVIMVSTFL